jgi:hypothetical protein
MVDRFSFCPLPMSMLNGDYAEVGIAEDPNSGLDTLDTLVPNYLENLKHTSVNLLRQCARTNRSCCLRFAA